jgi:hypothetical protein
MTPARVLAASMTRTALSVALLGLTLASLPLALAQEGNATRPDDAAWVDDCPPDMMCAAADPQPYGADGCIECTGGPVDQPPGAEAQAGAADAKNEVPVPSLVAALAIVGVAALAVSLLGRR